MDVLGYICLDGGLRLIGSQNNVCEAQFYLGGQLCRQRRVHFEFASQPLGQPPPLFGSSARHNPNLVELTLQTSFDEERHFKKMSGFFPQTIENQGMQQAVQVSPRERVRSDPRPEPGPVEGHGKFRNFCDSGLRRFVGENFCRDVVG
ncbi:MAG: hypothetical protein L6Q31_10010 [Fimbriimonadaceae bacterium]|nr:hypothetical protein [Fimbriimonadaceae bacterium]